MNPNLLIALVYENGETGRDFARVIKKSEKTGYSKMKGEKPLTLDELALIKVHYKLTDERFMSIFFAKYVA